MRAKRIIVTGGAGYIGSHTVVALTEAGYAPIILDNFIHGDRTPYEGLCALLGDDIPLYEGDCRDKNVLNTIAQVHGPIEGVIHFAALKSVPESIQDPYAYYDNNVMGIVGMLSFVRRYEVPVFIFSSSASVYGVPAHLPVTEDSPIGVPLSPYAHTKQIGEAIIQQMQMHNYLTCGVSLRYFNPIGAHPSALIGEISSAHPTNLLPCLMNAIVQKRPLHIYGNEHPTSDGTCIRDYLHVVDLANAHVATLHAAFKGQISGYEVLNVGTGRGHSVQEVIDAFSRENKVKILCKIAPPRAGDAPVLYAAVDKMTNRIGWRAYHTMNQALQDAWEWHAKQAE